jgi:transcriptional regulator with XRE-family HTH domain
MPAGVTAIVSSHACDNGGMPIVVVPSTALGARLRDLREGQEWSQWDLARALSTKANRVSDWETGLHEPTLALLRRIAAVYEITVAELLDGVM